MENQNLSQDTQININSSINFAAQQLIADVPRRKVINSLVEKGMNENDASSIVDKIEGDIDSAKKSKAKKDMLYGALWCVGGLVVTLSGVGVIAWGAILFGAIQFFKGLANS